MKSDVKGCSTCPRGEEQYEEFYSSILKEYRVEYDYRDEEGRLFTTNAPDLATARTRRDAWAMELHYRRDKKAVVRKSLPIYSRVGLLEGGEWVCPKCGEKDTHTIGFSLSDKEYLECKCGFDFAVDWTID